MAIDSSSTDAEVYASYDDNASYEADGSATKARAFITACLILLRRRPSSVSVDGETVAFDSGRVQAEVDHARRWLASASSNTSAGGGQVRHLSLNRMRD